MDLGRLRTLREFADRGSVTAAARALHCTPSAISQQLRALQAEVGIALTEPAGRGLRLTDAGRALVARADDVLAALDRAEAELATYRSAPRGRVRIAIFQSAGLMLLPGLLRRIEQYDNLEVDVRDVDMVPPQVPGLVADYDVVVAHRDEHAPEFDTERLDVVPLLREPLDVALPVGHRLARNRRVGLADLADERWISVDHGFPVDDVLRSLTVRTGVRPQIVQRINDFRITERLVAAGHGIALMPRYTMDTRRGSGLVGRPLAGIRAARLVEVVCRTGAANRPAVATVIDELRAEVAALTT
ncbi:MULTISPECIES: LysR family transcriptional regulator [Amycolatopsis]|uniref:LysR family transcriptional regulator n=1 Tax=Amycolatopsis dendrobii TaxID=2760662 RepID=A0A7W3VYL2_9PSEU|nr:MULTISPECIES: LysR family transcriptional regulator [Amycolatopsis]MBB1155613.1 LysR family transcriptional regulator [Amycolatopsis dendrobii]UKD52825.1 LysR family transcriptional regulator [Amycolatopsis sp. FU40]